MTTADQLAVFAGEWRTTGTVLPTGAAFSAVDTYEWVAGGRFLLHRWDAQMAEGRSEGVEIIGYDAGGGDFAMHAFEGSGAVTTMRAVCDRGEWRFLGDALRFTGRFDGDGRTLSGQWEARDADGAWAPLMQVRLSRVERPARPGRQHEFRFYYFTRLYDETVAFYRDVLQFAVYHGWDHGPESRGTIFRAPYGAGLIEIEAGPDLPSIAGGFYMEVPDLDAWYARAREARAPIVRELGTTSYGHRNFKLGDPSGVEVGFFEYAVVPPHVGGAG